MNLIAQSSNSLSSSSFKLEFPSDSTVIRGSEVAATDILAESSPFMCCPISMLTEHSLSLLPTIGSAQYIVYVIETMLIVYGPCYLTIGSKTSTLSPTLNTYSSGFQLYQTFICICTIFKCFLAT